MPAGRFIAYYRVSTDKQGRSGLGLEAQREAVMRFLNGGRWELVGEYTEIESGSRDDRPELQKALRMARLKGARLVIAKLDRLSRDAYFLLGLQKAGVSFVAADMPDANELTVHIMAGIAEHERKVIGARTKAALAAAKARGVRLGKPENLSRRDKGTQRSIEVRSEKARARSQLLAPTITEMRSNGRLSLRQLAESLNEQNIPAPRGGAWSPVQVARTLERMQAEGFI
jgi:DNA invertase Pin-like site-specific DNA recombinase